MPARSATSSTSCGRSSEPGPRVRRLGPVALAMTLAGCSQAPPPRPAGEPATSRARAGETRAEETQAGAAQTLYRVHYEGPEGGGGLRLVMRQVAADRFQLRAADTFGRAVWSLDLDREQVLMVDHRRKEACLAGGELRVPEVALRPLPLPAVARVLDSQVPLPAPVGADRTDWVDEAGQRWTARWEGGELASWTLWQEGEPQLWWIRQPRGGILSHRDGSQFRWRQTAREELAPADYRRIEAPVGYRFGECRVEPGAAAEGR